MIKKALTRGLTTLFGAALVAAPLALPANVGATTSSGHGGTPVGQAPFSGTTHNVCPAVPAGYSTCLAKTIERQGEQTHISSFTRRFTPARGAAVVVSGVSPTQLESVYGFSNSASAGSGQTIAIVDAFNDPTATKDLSTFSTQYGLPGCPSATSCPTLSIVSQTGGSTSGVSTDGGWALEISLDIEWAHAIAPGAHVLLVEANDNSDSNLYTAERYAAAHANYVSNSWGGPEYFGQTTDDANTFTPSANVSYFAATGDSGSEVDYPATSPNVVAVGGTSLSFTSGGVFSSESAWSQGGGGCSAIESSISAQTPFSKATGCSGRSVPDVSLDSDPGSGVAVYDSTPQSPGGPSGWWTVGGTSVATPIWAAQSAVRGLHVTPQTVYTGTISFRDITSGSNGHPTLIGYDLATGRGSWAANAPAAPTSLSATGASGSVSLSWSSASGATSYNVYRASSAGKESTSPIGTGVTGTTYKDTTVQSGVTYYYEVEGVSSAGSGLPSNEASASPSGSSGPVAPTGLSASASTGQIALSWNTVSGASTYQILRGTASGQESSTPLVTGVTSNTYKDTSVTGGTTYYYEVEAVNSSGTSTPSNEASALAVGSSGGSGGTSTPTASYGHSCSLATCTFTSTSTDSGATLSTFAWSGGNGFSASGASAQHKYTQAGTYSVNLKVTDSKGASASTTGSVSCVLYFGIWLLCS